MSGSLTLSRDSTCEDDLHSATLGFETMALAQPDPPSPLPAIVEKAQCQFPAWLAAEWEDLSATTTALVHRDRWKDASAVLRCLERDLEHPLEEKYLVHSRNQW